jgi:hypothetical protein
MDSTHSVANKFSGTVWLMRNSVPIKDDCHNSSISLVASNVSLLHEYKNT